VTSATSDALRAVQLSDTTLRDGEQMPGAALTPAQKVRIARALADAGVSSLDAGFPACGGGEIEAIRRIVREVPGVNVSALCRALPADIDLAREALCEASPRACSVSLFIATGPLHREYKLRLGVTKIIHIVREAVEYARRHFEIVSFSAEDASRTEPEVLCEVYREAIDAGARVVGFPDTVGILTPSGVRQALLEIQDRVPNLSKARLACHFHNDLGLATANTLAALEAGVTIAQCTVNGIGERAGNTALEQVGMAIALHGEALGLKTNLRLEKLWALSRLVAQETGIGLASNQPVTGDNVFATEAGIHQHGLLSHLDTYLPFRPEKVGAEGVRLVLGKHSGRAAFLDKLSALGHELTPAELEAVVDAAKSAPKEAFLDVPRLLAAVVAEVRARAIH
jgi:2-isopropylmalate synthase